MHVHLSMHLNNQTNKQINKYLAEVKRQKCVISYKFTWLQTKQLHLPGYPVRYNFDTICRLSHVTECLFDEIFIHVWV